MGLPFLNRFLSAVCIASLFAAQTGCQTARTRAPASSGTDTTSIESTIDQIRSQILSQQKDHAYWSAPFTSDVTSDALVLALGQKLHKLNPALRDSYVDSIHARMLASGVGWPAYVGGPVDFNVTSIALLCMRAAGITEGDSRFQTAWQWFQNAGGEKKLQLYATMMMAPLDLVSSERVPGFTPRTFGMPKYFPMHLDREGFLRGLVVPSIGIRFLESLPDRSLTADSRTTEGWASQDPQIMSFSFKSPSKEGSRKCKIPEEDLDSFFEKVGADPDSYRDCVFYPDGSGEKFKDKLVQFFRQPMTEKIVGLTNFVIDRTIRGPKVFWAEQSLILELKLLNKGGAWYTMGFNLCGLRLLQEAQRVGLGNFQKEIDQAWDAVLAMRTKNQNGNLVQQWAFTGTWDTASTLVAFEPLKGTKYELPNASATVKWLLDHQIQSNGQRAWSFDETDHSLPDVDDTAMVLTALSQYQSDADPDKQAALTESMAWLLDKANHNGGYPAWATSMSTALVKIMHQTMMQTLADFSQPDVTGRVMYSLDVAQKSLQKMKASSGSTTIQDVLENTLIAQQHSCEYVARKMSKMRGPNIKLDPGNWMVNYVYSAASVLNGLVHVECDDDKQTELALFISSTQQADGGWGESPEGYASKSYVPAKTNTMQSAVALSGLIAYYEILVNHAQAVPQWLVPSIEKGLSFLVDHTEGGAHITDEEFSGVLVRGMTYTRYELAPAYLAVYALGRWYKLSPHPSVH